MARIVVKMGELVVSDREGDTLTSILGSCVGVIIFDPAGKRAGMAHVMLPHKVDPNAPVEKRAKYAGTAVKELCREMVSRGSSIGSLQAKLCGGARMFSDNNLQNIGERNVYVAKLALRRLKIPVVAERTGGDRGRNVIVDVATGLVKVKDAEGKVEVI
jgi:chemotaxis protein CheD